MLQNKRFPIDSINLYKLQCQTLFSHKSTPSSYQVYSFKNIPIKLCLYMAIKKTRQKTKNFSEQNEERTISFAK